MFAENLGFADFNRDMRNSLLACTRFDWSQISPAIFGSLFQGVMEPQERRQIGGHYTSERDILKVVRALFLDDLRAEFERIKGNKNQLRQFHQKLSGLRFLDPACGCGNFLVDHLPRVATAGDRGAQGSWNGGQQRLDIQTLSLVDVDAFYGIEISEWPARIAEVAMWLMDHQMNVRLSEAFGQYFVRLPLTKSPDDRLRQRAAAGLERRSSRPRSAVTCSAIRRSWESTTRHGRKRATLRRCLSNFRNVGDVDYVVGWFKRAAEYIRETHIKVGFVATNSITQGEQVPLVWGEILDRYGLTIHFAHRTFTWESEARGKAHVHVVIIGFAAFENGPKRLYDYDADPKNATAVLTPLISPYLTPGASVLVTKRQKPLANVPEMRCGNKPADGGHLILTDEEREDLLREEPEAKHLLRRFTGSQEFINGKMRWCLWLEKASPTVLRRMPRVWERIEAVKEFRERSTAKPTQEAANAPMLFFYVSQPKTSYVAVPEVSSIRRRYIPIGFLPASTIASNKIYLIPSPSLYLFGVLSSAMHMAWTRQVCGRLKSDFQYSASMVYNTFPWPESRTEKQMAAVEAAAQRVLDAREEHLEKGATLADLYDPLVTPLELVKAHNVLNRAVDRCYRSQPFTSDRQRVEFLFALYERLTAPLLPKEAKKKRRE